MSAAQEEAKTQLTAAIERIRHEEAERHTAELARVREELERQYADDLQRAQTSVVESFKALTGSVLERVLGPSAVIALLNVLRTRENPERRTPLRALRVKIGRT